MQVVKNTKANTPLKTTIGFSWGYILEKVQRKHFDMVYTIEENCWKDQISMQLIIKDFKFYT